MLSLSLPDATVVGVAAIMIGTALPTLPVPFVDRQSAGRCKFHREVFVKIVDWWKLLGDDVIPSGSWSRCQSRYS